MSNLGLQASAASRHAASCSASSASSSSSSSSSVTAARRLTTNALSSAAGTAPASASLLTATVSGKYKNNAAGGGGGNKGGLLQAHASKLKKKTNSANSAPSSSSSSSEQQSPLLSSSSIYPQWHNMAAGAFSGFGARLFTAPLDLIKIRRQVSQYVPFSQTKSTIGRTGGSSLLNTMQTIVKEEGGIRGLFRGNLAATYLWVGYAMVQFAIYGKASRYLSSHPPLPPPPSPPSPQHLQSVPFRHSSSSSTDSGGIDNCSALSSYYPGAYWWWYNCRRRISSNPTMIAFLSGAIGGVSATIATYPFDITRTAFATQGALLVNANAANAASIAASSGTTTAPLLLQGGGGRQSMVQFTQNMMKTYGPRGFFAGCVPACAQTLPYMGLNFALYDAFNRILSKEKKNRNIGNAGAIGFVAGGMSRIIVYPLDTVKKRLQAQTFLTLLNGGSTMATTTAAMTKEAAAAAAKRTIATYQYRGMIDCIIKVGKEEGLRAFYRGMVPNTIKTAMATGLTFAFFTAGKNVLESIHDDDDRKKERFKL